MRDVGLRGAADSRVAEFAAGEGRILLTADLDFPNALRFPPATHPGIIIVRLPDVWSPTLRAERAVAAIEEAGPDRLRGAIAIIEPTRIRIFGASPPSAE